MFKVILHEEVVKFLENSGTVWWSDGEKSYIVNNSWYKPTDEENIFTVEFLKTEEPHGN